MLGIKLKRASIALALFGPECAPMTEGNGRADNRVLNEMVGRIIRPSVR